MSGDTGRIICAASKIFSNIVSTRVCASAEESDGLRTVRIASTADETDVRSDVLTFATCWSRFGDAVTVTMGVVVGGDVVVAGDVVVEDGVVVAAAATTSLMFTLAK